MEEYGNDPNHKDRKYVEKIIADFEKKQGERSQWENNWQECYDNIVPRKSDVISTRTEGDKRGNDLFDSTAIMANNLLSGALHGMLTNPTTRFFDLVMGDPKLDEDEEVKNWLQEVGERMFTIISNSNFQTEIHEIYIDLGAIGTACLYMGEDDERFVHFSARAMKEIYISENNQGLVDSVTRKFQWKPKQIIQEFGIDKVPTFVKEQYEKGCTENWDILHVVEPKESFDEYSKDIPFNFKSCYVLKDQKIKLHEGGFKEFPYAVPRWTKTSGETYGRGPGMDMLPDIKMVNVMMETTLKGAQKTVDPPLMVSDDGVIGRVRLTPGGLTVVRPSNDLPIRPLITDARIDFGYQAVEDVRRRIREGFYVNQFIMAEGPQKTATEVMQQTEEKFRLMGPVLGRQHFELLRPVVERLFGIMLRKGQVPPIPQQIAGRNFDVRYSSFIARVQRMNEGQNLSRAIQTAAPIFQIDPAVADNLDGDKIIKYVMDIFGVPGKLLHKDQEVKEKRDARAEAQAQAAQEKQGQAVADQIGTAGPALAQLQQAQAAQQQ